MDPGVLGPGGDTAHGTRPPVTMLPIVWLALITVVLGLSAESLVEFSSRAAQGPMDPGAYLAAVLGG